MKIPKPGTMFTLAVDTPYADMVIRDHGWLYKFLFWDINMDQFVLTSVATGDRVYIDTKTVKSGYLKEYADGLQEPKGPQLQA